MHDRLKDPEYRAPMKMQQRLSMQRIYPYVAIALNLTPQQTQDLFELLREQQLRTATARMGSADEDEASQREHLRCMQELQQKNEAELIHLRGADRAPAWKDYQRSLGTRMQVRELRTLPADTSEPLSPEQAEPFIASLTAEQRPMAAELRSGNADPTSMMKRHFETQLRHLEHRKKIAATYLSPEQQRVFGELVDQQIATMKAQQKLTEAQAANLMSALAMFAPDAAAPGVAIVTSKRAANAER
jgi:hypothetical protein